MCFTYIVIYQTPTAFEVPPPARRDPKGSFWVYWNPWKSRNYVVFWAALRPRLCSYSELDYFLLGIAFLPGTLYCFLLGSAFLLGISYFLLGNAFLLGTLFSTRKCVPTRNLISFSGMCSYSEPYISYSEMRSNSEPYFLRGNSFLLGTLYFLLGNVFLLGKVSPTRKCVPTRNNITIHLPKIILVLLSSSRDQHERQNTPKLPPALVS